jgi:iron complex outermembrane receptor protein
MKKPVFPLRLALLPLVLCAALPAWPQSSLQPVLVTATRFPEPAASLPLGVSVITAQEIEASGAATVNEALMRVLGVVGRQDFFGGGEYNLDLRGFGPAADSNQLVIVDGLRVSEADLGGTRLAGIPIESVERIEVLRGSGAVLYGEGATGGVIVITTKAGGGKERRNGASVYAGAGSFGLRDLRAGATLAGGGFSLDASTQKRESDNHRENFRSRTDAAAVTGQWANEWLRFGARLSRDSLDTGLPGALSPAQYDADPRQTTTPGDHAHIRNERDRVSGRGSSPARRARAGRTSPAATPDLHSTTTSRPPITRCARATKPRSAASPMCWCWGPTSTAGAATCWATSAPARRSSPAPGT